MSFNVFVSLTKDMTGKEDMYRPAAIRALCKITDVSLRFYRYKRINSPHVKFIVVTICAEHDVAGHRAVHEAGDSG